MLPGMSIFRFSVEFRFYFLLSAFLKIIFRLFFKSRRRPKKKKKRGRSPMPPISGEFKELATVGRVQRASVHRCSLFPFLVKVRKHGISTWHLKSDTPNHAPPRRLKEREGRVVVKWRDGGGARSDHHWASHCTLTIELQHLHPLPFPLLFSPASLYTHRDTRAHVRAHTHAHTHTIHSGIFTPFFSPQESVSLSVCLSVCLSLSLSLSHTHTHTQRFHTFLLTRAQQCLLRHQSMLKIAWPETHLSSTPLLSLSAPSCPPLYYHYKQATFSSFF